jgi:type IV pilus assembly protein PilM
MTGRRKRGWPRLACEIAADRVIAARAGHGDSLGNHSVRSLPAGAIAPSLNTENVIEGGRLRESIGEALADIGARSGDIAAVLPDASIRVTLLEFDELPHRDAEIAGIVRFRLRKSVPFEIERAALSYHVLPRNGANIRVVAAVALQSVVEEYEAAFRDEGYDPGVVLPSMAAALKAVDAPRPTLAVKVDTHTTTIAIVDRSELRLFRTLETPAGATGRASSLADEIYPSMVFYQDTYGAAVERIVVAGSIAAPELAAALGPQAPAQVDDLVHPQQVGTSGTGAQAPVSQLAGVLGALLG